MLFEIILVFLLMKCAYFLFEKRRIFYFSRRLQNDMSCNVITGHASYFVGDEEKRMTAFRLLGMEAIKHAGMTAMWLLHRFFVVVADADIAALILRTSLEKSDVMKVSRNLIGNGSIFAPVSIWRPRRKLIAPAFAQRNLNEFVAIFDKCSRSMVRQLQQRVGEKPFSIWKYVAAYAMDSICETSLDVNLNVQSNPDHPFLKAIDGYIRMVSKRVCYPWLHNDTIYDMIPWYAACRTYIQLMWDFVDNIIKSKRASLIDTDNNNSNFKLNHKASSRRSLVDLLMKPSKDAGYTDIELREELLVITIAGTDTSATGAAFALAMLARSTSIRERVHHEIQEVFGDSDRVVTPADLQRLKYLDATVRETLRLYPPVPVIVRTLDEDVNLPNGDVLPKGCDVLVNMWAIHRNPRHWGADVNEFKPERFLNAQQNPAFMAFSSGQRNCLGYQYAMMSMKTLLCNILRHYSVRHARREDPVELTGEPLRVKFDIMMKDVDEWTIRLVNKD